MYSFLSKISQLLGLLNSSEAQIDLGSANVLNPEPQIDLGSVNVLNADNCIRRLQTSSEYCIDLRGNARAEKLTSSAEKKKLIDYLIETGKIIQLNEPLATEFRNKRSSISKQYGTFFDEAKSNLPDDLVNEIFEFNYPKPSSL